jgi:hypothetical protein
MLFRLVFFRGFKTAFCVALFWVWGLFYVVIAGVFLHPRVYGLPARVAGTIPQKTGFLLYIPYYILLIVHKKRIFCRFSSALLQNGSDPVRGPGAAGQQKSTAAAAAVLFVFFVLQPKAGHSPAPLCYLTYFIRGRLTPLF